MALAENGQVVFLQGTRSVDQGEPLKGGWAKGARLTCIPQPLSVICSSFRPPSLTSISRDVEPASTAFSMSSFRACTGATIISPAAILLTTSGSKALIRCQLVMSTNLDSPTGRPHPSNGPLARSVGRSNLP